MNNWHTIKRS